MLRQEFKGLGFLLGAATDTESLPGSLLIYMIFGPKFSSTCIENIFSKAMPHAALEKVFNGDLIEFLVTAELRSWARIALLPASRIVPTVRRVDKTGCCWLW